MPDTTHVLESSVIPAVYVALELSATEWLLTLSPGPGSRRQRVRLRPGDRAAFERAVARARTRWGLPPAGPVRSCYEAGRDGFWPHRWLTALGVINLVVDSSSIEVSRRARPVKTDRVDGEKLLRLLVRYWSGERTVWHVVDVPSPEVEDARHASRALSMIQAERTRYRNRIRALLALHGVRVERIDEPFGVRVATLRAWDGAPLPPGVQARVQQLWRVLQTIETERRAAMRVEAQQVRQGQPGAAACARRLMQLRGVAARSATVLAHELFTRPLRNRRQVGARAGLVSAPSQSGRRQRDQGLMRSGVPAVRRIAVELAWAWRRYQPQSALTRWYEARFGHGGAGARRLGIVALARRLIIALWRYAHAGPVPAGAMLKA